MQPPRLCPITVKSLYHPRVEASQSLSLFRDRLLFQSSVNGTHKLVAVVCAVFERFVILCEHLALSREKAHLETMSKCVDRTEAMAAHVV